MGGVAVSEGVARAVMGRASGENFPVASRVLPSRVRAHLLAVYGFARLVDEIGDGGDGPAAGAGSAAERLAALDELEADLDRAYRGEAHHPLLVALEPTLRERALPREPFVRLIEANRMDQRVARYDTWEQLRGYCQLSASPVGELVLGVFGAATPERVRRSDAVCTALQLVEHCQDVAEDRDRGRVYLPREDLAACGASEADLRAEHAGEALKRTIALELARARALFDDGAPLIGELSGVRERLATAAFVAGGRAACDAIERAGCEVLAGPPRAGAWLRVRALARTLRERRRRTPPGTPAMTLEDAYRHCELTTRREAANFYYGIRLLAPARRRAMCAVYAFARRVDDIGDGELPSARKLTELQRQDRALAALEAGPSAAATGEAAAVGGGAAMVTLAPATVADDPVSIALADSYQRFRIPPDALRALIAGVRMDVADVRYETFDELVVYCRRVAGAIGRACLAIFAPRAAHTDMSGADRLADDLGVALQITNILRDIREDSDRGRTYLPAEDLRRFEVAAIHDPHELERVEALVRFEAARAREWFDRGIALAPLLDRRSRACLLAMAGIYSRLLDRIAADPSRPLRERVSLPMREKAWVAVRSMLGSGL